MRSLSILGLGFLASMATADERGTWLKGDQYANKCGGTTWNQKTSASSPLARDCSAIVDDLAGEETGGVMLSGLRGLSTVRREGTCHFGVEPHDVGGFYMGRDDMADLIRDAISMWTKDGKVGGGGVTKCGDMEVKWSIY
ncbi:hypothetical protein SCUP234_03760 [Seiridium cupressi]